MAIPARPKPSFIVRLVPASLTHCGPGGGRRLRGWRLGPGQAIDLSIVRVRHDQVVEVWVMGVWAPRPVGTMVAGHRADIAPGRHYGLERRMTIEEPWHDTKGYRFEIGSEWLQSRTAAYLAHLTLLMGVVLALWTTVEPGMVRAALGSACCTSASDLACP
jgi:hypothetical protein